MIRIVIKQQKPDNMKKSTILFIFLLSCEFVHSQYHEFPADWLGSYTGELFISGTGTTKIDTLKISFDFLISPRPDSWIYRMTYESKKFGLQVKDYELLKPDSLPQNSYLLNEKDGIMIQMVCFGNALYANFSVAGQYLTSIMRKEANSIVYEITVSRESPSLVTQNQALDNQETYLVRSFPPYSLQSARLVKNQE